jgi:pilus assembly protein CpaF
MEDNGVISLNHIFKFERDLSDMKKTKGEFQVLTSPSRTIEQMNMFGVEIDKRIFNPDFVMTKEMLIEELRKDLPSKMCGWRDEHLDAFIQRDDQLFHKWPHFQDIQKSDSI